MISPSESKGERRFDGRVVVVTGAGRGLGREYALLLAAKGASVVVNDNGGSMQGDGADAGPAHDVVRDITAAGGDAVACTETVATPDGGAAIVRAALDRYGRVDALIHNAGNVRYASLAEVTLDEFRSVVDVHFMGAFHVVQPAFRAMCAAGYGRIVLTSSIGGLYGNRNVLSYAMAKMGMTGLNNVAAVEGADRGVKSNIIVPAAVTRMAEGLDISRYPPMGPDLVAPAVAWLAHESCSITGETLVAIAGRVARALIAETNGVYRPSWSIDEIADSMEAIRDTHDLWTLSPVPSGFAEHMDRSFAMVWPTP